MNWLLFAIASWNAVVFWLLSQPWPEGVTNQHPIGYKVVSVMFGIVSLYYWSKIVKRYKA